jgi:hypothetical protein
MKAFGALTESVPLSDAAPDRRPAPGRSALDAVQEAQVPWLLALIPVGSLVMAGLLILMLGRFVALPPPPPSPEAGLDQPDLGAPAVDEIGDDEWVVRVGPAYTR